VAAAKTFAAAEVTAAELAEAAEAEAAACCLVNLIFSLYASLSGWVGGRPFVVSIFDSRFLLEINLVFPASLQMCTDVFSLGTQHP